MELLASFDTPADTATAPGRVVLYDRGGFQPFVTWWENRQDGGRYWGHYFSSRKEAEADFRERCKRGY